ncbi:MAG TPA: phage Gp37/Gp68 family protein [Stellaceae bacterium]|nr:phage Gp37/Gp68 family protein [Stellaceae bacterium]
MAETSLIEWTDATWNPVTGCSVVSPGCTNCYAMRLAGGRLARHPSRAGLTDASKAGPVWNGRVQLNEGWLDQPLRWTRPRRIFVCAHGDLFHEGVPDAWIDRVFAVMALAPHHTFQVLTKRAARMRDYVTDFVNGERHVFGEARAFATACELDQVLPEAADTLRPLSNVWLGVSAEDQARADERVPQLLRTPAALRFVSAEPLLGPIALRRLCAERKGLYESFIDAPCGRLLEINAATGQRTIDMPTPYPGLDWVIAGGESGPGARPMHPDWARQIRDDCAAAGVPFFFKQWGEWAPDHQLGGGVGDSTCAVWAIDGWRYFPSLDAVPDCSASLDDRLYRVGKKAAGRLLDGRTHDAMPERAHG